jgi:hypothetical protein
MTIAPGTRLGRYEIRSKIGEVAFYQDRMRRFNQEGRAA